MSRRSRRLALIFSLGLACALPLGGALGLLAGWQWSTGPASADSAQSFLQELRLKATASHGASSFSMATGSIDNEVEGIYALDFLTGDLTCWVMPTGNAAGGIFKVNVLGDLPPEKGKAPAYVMVTGLITINNVTGNTRPANTIVYVADSNTGVVAGYSVPWNRAMAKNGTSQEGTMMKVFGPYSARQIRLRE